MDQRQSDGLLSRRPCHHCCALFSPDKLLTCSGCKRVSYCSKECQKKGWKSHKPLCKLNKSTDDQIEQIAMGQPYEQLLRTQFEKFCEFVHPTVAAAAAQAYMLHAEGYPAPSSEGVPTPLPTPSTHVLLVIFEFDMGEKDLRRQFNFVGASLAPITEMQRRDRGACNQVISKPEPGTFTRQWLDNTVGMARLPPNAPRLPIAFEAHFARSTWRATGGPSFTAHYTGMSASLVLPPGLSFPTPPPQKDYVKHLGDRLHDMKDPEYEKKQQVAAAAVKQKYYYAAMTAPGGAEIMQLNRVWEWRASHQRFYGMDD